MKGKNRSKSKGNVSVVRGRAQLGAALTNTSNVGNFVIDRIEFDNTVGATIDQLSKVFARWRLKKLKLHFASMRPTSDVGLFGMAILEDPDSTTPGTQSAAMGMRVSCVSHLWQSQSLSFKPLKEGWLFTRDTIGNDDRLQMPCDLLFFSANCTASVTPGVIWYEYHIEWCEIANSTVLPQSIALKRKEDKKVDKAISAVNT